MITKRELSVLAAASTDQTRENLNAVAFEASGPVVATNGHILFAYLPTGEIPAESEGTTLIKRDDVAALRKTLGAKGQAERSSGSRFTAAGGVCFDFAPIESEFPDWRKCLPTHEARTVRLDARYLKLACEAAIASGAEYVDVTGSDESACAPVKLVAHSSDGAQLLAIVMPARR